MTNYVRAPRGATSIAEINVTPLIDVMLVLLIVFMMATPILTRGLVLDLPNAPPTTIRAETPPIRVAIDANGAYYWDGSAIGLSKLPEVMAQAARRDPQPMIEVAAAADADYQAVANILASAKNAGLTKIGLHELDD